VGSGALGKMAMALMGLGMALLGIEVALKAFAPEVEEEEEVEE
jgi:hypothetical protein